MTLELVIACLLLLAGLMQWGIARDRMLWVSYAVESFRYCVAWGFIMLALRILYIAFEGDSTPGMSLWGACALASLAIGHVGLQMNNLSLNTLHVPKFLRRAIE